jgi:hypothetical protein
VAELRFQCAPEGFGLGIVPGCTACHGQRGR